MNKHEGSSFDEFLKKEGILDECSVKNKITDKELMGRISDLTIIIRKIDEMIAEIGDSATLNIQGLILQFEVAYKTAFVSACVAENDIERDAHFNRCIAQLDDFFAFAKERLIKLKEYEPE